jgi:hypothetical protein
MRIWNREKWEISYWARKIPVTARVSRLDLLSHLPVYLGPGFLRKYKQFIVKHRALSYPPTPYFNNHEGLPAIEITIDCAAKDSKLLSNVIELAELNVLNPISVISVVVPSSDFELISDQISKTSYKSPIRVLDENSILAEEIRNKIKVLFPNRYGWVIHQFLTLQQILNSSSLGVLSIDSDTLILRPMAFLNSDGIQVLMESLEYNRPYYEFLNRINPVFKIDSTSHVTHYSFFQKSLLLGIFEKVGIRTLIDLVDCIESYADLDSSSPICIDRELYALGLLAFYPEKCTLVKFANISVSYQEIYDPIQLEQLSKKYNSVSAHSYLQAST